MVLNDLHFSIKTTPEINEICTPLFSKTNVSIFSYVRVYNEGKLISLTTNPVWQKYYYEKEYYKYPNAISTCINVGQHLLCSHLCLSDMIKEAKSLFGIDNLFELVTKHTNYYEILRFGGSAGDNRILELYLNRQDFLMSFKFYFLEYARCIISDALSSNNLIDLSKYVNNNGCCLLDKATQLKIINDGTKRYYVGPNKYQYLTKRQLECLLRYLQGKNSVEIAEILGLSEKTVRSYLKDMLLKMEVETKSELIQKAMHLGFLKLVNPRN